jgi:hypothetical protein
MGGEPDPTWLLGYLLCFLGENVKRLELEIYNL